MRGGEWGSVGVTEEWTQRSVCGTPAHGQPATRCEFAAVLPRGSSRLAFGDWEGSARVEQGHRIVTGSAGLSLG